MSDTEPAIRMIDLNEHVLVVTVDRHGLMAVHVRGICNDAAARMLTEVGAQLKSAHPPFPCHWDAERDTPVSADRPDEPLVADRGRLDAERRVWTDGTGHAWDLSVPWEDAAHMQWKWTGRLDGRGAPWMRSADDVDEQPLDVLRAVMGPISPVGGEES